MPLLHTGHVPRRAEMLDLFNFEHLIDWIDRAIGAAGDVELLDRSLGRLGLDKVADLGVSSISPRAKSSPCASSPSASAAMAGCPRSCARGRGRFPRRPSSASRRIDIF